MPIVLLLIASVILVATMLFLTLCVNELEKKTLEVSAMLRKRYVIVMPEKGKDGKKKAAASAGMPMVAQGIAIPGKTPPKA